MKANRMIFFAQGPLDEGRAKWWAALWFWRVPGRNSSDFVVNNHSYWYSSEKMCKQVLTTLRVSKTVMSLEFCIVMLKLFFCIVLAGLRLVWRWEFHLTAESNSLTGSPNRLPQYLVALSLAAESVNNGILFSKASGFSYFHVWLISGSDTYADE